MDSFISGFARRVQSGTSLIDTTRSIKPAPVISLSDHVLQNLRTGLKTWVTKFFIVDVASGTQVTFSELEHQSTRVASALVRLGFRRGSVLYHVTGEMAQSYVVMLAVWRLGGTVRGAWPNLTPEEYARQIRECGALTLMIDADSAPVLREAAILLGWPIHLLNVGNKRVADTTSFADLVHDDGTAFPTRLVEVAPDEDVVLISSAESSTGALVPVFHTHATAIEFMYATKGLLPETSIMHSMPVSGVFSFALCLQALCSGVTIFHVRNERPSHPLFTLQYRDFGEMLELFFCNKVTS